MWFCKLQKLIEERAEEMRSALPDTTEEREVDWNQAFLDVVPLDDKKRMFGTGGLARIIANDSSISTSQYHTQAACGSRITEMELQLSKEREERRMLTEHTQKMQEDLQHQQRQIEQLLSQSQTSSLAP